MKTPQFFSVLEGPSGVEDLSGLEAPSSVLEGPSEIEGPSGLEDPSGLESHFQFLRAPKVLRAPQVLRAHDFLSAPLQFLKAPQRLALQMNSFSMAPSTCQKAAVWVTRVRWFTQNRKQNSSRSWGERGPLRGRETSRERDL